MMSLPLDLRPLVGQGLSGWVSFCFGVVPAVVVEVVPAFFEDFVVGGVDLVLSPVVVAALVVAALICCFMALPPLLGEGWLGTRTVLPAHGFNCGGLTVFTVPFFGIG